MSSSLYSDPELYDRVFPPGPYGPFYLEQARRGGGAVLELACGTGQLLVPIARAGFRATGLDSAEPMLAAARRRAREAETDVEFISADMREFDLGQRYSLVFIARNSLLHLSRTEDILACFASVHRHLEPGGTFVFDVFNPDVALLARPPHVRFPVMRFGHPDRGAILVEATCDYEAESQVNRATWYFSTPEEPDFLVAPLPLRSIFPQELPLLIAAGGMRLEARFGDFSGAPLESASRHQICVCRPA